MDPGRLHGSFVSRRLLERGAWRRDRSLLGGSRPVPVARPNAPLVTFQRVPEVKSVKNRLHFDVTVDDGDSATVRIESLGGSQLSIEDFSEDGFSWRVMADPEGNEFCLIFRQP